MTPSTRLWYAPERRSDEPADSWVRKTAAIYGVSPAAMVDHLVEDQREDDEGRLLGRAALATADRRHGLTPPGPYCPICFSRDLHHGRLPSFRTEWQAPWTTHCRIDGVPLFLWPYRDATGLLAYPEWVAKAHFLKKARACKDQRDQAFRIQLRYARGLQEQIRVGADEALPWIQQVEQERVLVTPGGVPCRMVLGMTPSAVRPVVNDLSVLLGHNFGRSGRCQAADLAGFLGPSWLFASSFASGRALPGHLTLCLASFTDPAQRRSLITLSMRLLMSFAADPEFTQSGAIVSVGQTMLSRELKSFPEPAKRWARARAVRWPKFVVIGIRGAMRCEAERWAGAS